MGSSNDDHQWHVAINKFAIPGSDDWPKFMYEAKDMVAELQRLPLLFKAEREGTLTKTHKQCSLSPKVPVPSNELTCCLGRKCKECPYLLALERAELSSPDALDRIKAATCVAHVLMEGGDFANEGYILTTDDRMFWDNVYSSLSQSDDEGEVRNAAD